MNIINIALLCLILAFGIRRLAFIMKFLQQQSYYNIRLWRFMFKKLQLIDKRVFIPLLVAAFFPKLIWLPIIALIVQIIIEKNPKIGIKPLNWTGRVKRIYGVALFLWIAAAIVSFSFSAISLYCYAAMALLAPIFLMMSNFILIPYQKLEEKKYLDEAKAKLKKFKPIVIGITGSYGKTSLKNILHHILGTFTTSFATKRSINTLMGIVRVIREEMLSAPKFFVAEIGIGAKHQMPQLLKFLNPNFGIITAIGAAHLENFRSINSTAREKFRLSKCVLKNGGETILASQNIDPKYIEKYKSEKDIIFSGDEIKDVKQTIEGLSFTLNYEKKNYKIFAPIYGIHQAQNIALAFIMARKLKVPAEDIILSLKSLKQTEHRLEVKREGDLIVVDDAFNSNINGFLSALETCAEIKGNGRFILITPGMIELGKMHSEQHKKIGIVANKLCDFVVAVNPDRIEDFTKEISKDKLVMATSLKEAREWLTKNARKEDVVLYENDLPDLYIEKISV